VGRRGHFFEFLLIPLLSLPSINHQSPNGRIERQPKTRGDCGHHSSPLRASWTMD
jgi:hypothetical protein